MNDLELQQHLNDLSFGPNWVGGVYHPHLTLDGQLGAQSKDAVIRFQECWNPASDPNQWLAVDGDAGPKTRDAVALSVWLGGLVSPHFRSRELMCTHCGLITVRRDLLHADEVYRSAFDPNGLTLVSATRCAVHNAQVGGASNSTHIPGGAGDLPKQRHVNDVLPLKIFSGLEISHDGWVVHGDVRHTIRGYNPNGFTVDRPAIFTWPTTLVQMLTEGWVCRS